MSTFTEAASFEDDHPLNTRAALLSAGEDFPVCSKAASMVPLTAKSSTLAYSAVPS